MATGASNKRKRSKETNQEERVFEENMKALGIKKSEEDEVSAITQLIMESLQEFTSSGSYPLDLQLGGGLPWGWIVNLVGDNSTGKTLLALEILYNGIKKYEDKFKWFYDDAEHGFGFNSKELYGFDAVPEDQENSITIGSFEHHFRKFLNNLKDDEYGIYVLDSLDGLTSDAEMERSDEKFKLAEEGKTLTKGSYNLNKQRELTEFFRTRAGEIKEKNCILLVISQVRANLEMFGKKFTRSGGKGLDHWANQVIWLYRCDKIEKTYKGKKYLLGISIRAEIEKNKSGKPFRESVFDIIFDYGVDNIGACIDYLYDFRTDLGKLKSGKTKIVFGTQEFDRDQLIDFVTVNPKMMDELMKSVYDKFMEIENQLKPKRSKI